MAESLDALTRLGLERSVEAIVDAGKCRRMHVNTFSLVHHMCIINVKTEWCLRIQPCRFVWNQYRRLHEFVHQRIGIFRSFRHASEGIRSFGSQQSDAGQPVIVHAQFER